MEELEAMYKELASIEKKIAGLNSQLYDMQPGSQEIKELGKQLSDLESQFAAVVNKIIATENKLVASSTEASESFVSAASSKVRSNNEIVTSIQQAETELSGYDKLMEGIGNQIPSLAEDLKGAVEEYKVYQDELKAGAGNVGKTIPLWKYLTTSIFSWQSALSVGIFLLDTYWKDIVNFTKGLFGASQEQEGLTESMIDFNKQSILEMRGLRDTYSAIMDTNQGTEERKKAIDDMNTKYGKFLPYLLTEKSSLEEINAAYETVNKSLRTNTALKMQNNAIEKVMETAIVEQAEGLAKMRSVSTKGVGGIKSDTIMNIIPDVTEDFRLAGQSWVKAYHGVVDKIQGELGGQKLDSSFYEELEDYVKNVYDSEQKVEDVRKNFKPLVKNGESSATYDHDNEDRMRNEEKRKAQEAAAEIQRIRKELAHSLLETEIRIQSERISLTEEGKNKRLELAYQEHDETIRQIDEEEKARLSLPAATDEQKKQVTNDASALRLLENEKLLKATAALDAEYEASYQEHMNTLSGVFVNQEQRKLSAIKDRYDKERSWADGQLRTGGMSPERHQSFTTTVDKAQQQETYRSLLEGLNEYKQKEKDLGDEWDTKINAAVEAKDAYLVARLMEGKQKAISALNGQALKESDEWQKLFGNLDTLTVSQIDSLITTINSKSKEMNLNPLDLKVVTDNLQKARQVVIETNPFATLGKSFKEVFSSGTADSKKSTGEVKNDWANLAKSTKGCFDFVNEAVASCGVLGDLLGESGKQVMGMIQGVATAGIAMGAAIKTAEAGSIVLAAISVALQVVTALFSLFNGDKKHEKKIQSMQKEVDELGRSYDRLGRTIDNTYSNAVYGMMDEQAENLKRQQQLVLQQKEEEEAKKKTDKKKAQEYDDKYEELGNQAEDLRKKQIEMLAGTDVQSAIDNFADALVEAYAQGADGAEAMGEVTKKVLANAVKEALKKQLLGDALKNAVTRLGEDMKDGTLSDEDKRRFENSAQSAGQRFMAAMGMYDELFKSDIPSDSGPTDGVSGQLQAAMTEGTASQLVGLWNSTSLDMRMLRDVGLMNGETVNSMLADVREIIRVNTLVEQNTRRGADNTNGLIDELRGGFSILDTRLSNIERNTKSSNSRG